MRPLLNWIRSWMQAKSSKADQSPKPSSLDHVSARNTHIDTSTLCYDAHMKPHHYSTSSQPTALPAAGHQHHHHHHHHDLRLLKSCRVMPLLALHKGENNHSNNDGDDIDNYDDDNDVDIEFSTMMMATITHLSSHHAQDTHLTSTVTFSPKPDTIPHSKSMPKAHYPSPCSPAPNMNLRPQHSMGSSMPHSLTPPGSPIVHPASTHTKKSSRMPRSPLLWVLGRPPLPDSSSIQPTKQMPIPQSPSTYATRHPPTSPLSSNARAKDNPPPTTAKSPSTWTKGSSKTPHSPMMRAMACPTTACLSPTRQLAMERQLQSPLPKVRKSAHGPSTHPSSCLNSKVPTYQPLCCSSGTCILECHVVDTPKKTESQAHKKPLSKKPTKYAMTILPSKDGSRRVRRISFKNGKWILDDSDYVVLEL